MKQDQKMMSRWIKGLATTASMFVFSVSLASGNDMTTAPSNASTPYSYTDPTSTSAPSYNDVGRPVDAEASSLTLNNQALGLAGPVEVSGGYSANYGYEVNASFSHMLGLYDAVSLLGAYAPQENRIDITWAHAWTEKQRTKLSVERLAEEMDFDYDSGTATEWVPQYSYGAGYQYLFNKNWLKNVELNGYYAQAQSQDLDTIRFTGTDGNLYDNYRHIAGATSKGSEATLNVSPWKTGLVGLGLNYDSVNYDTKYEDTDAEDSKGFGFTLSLEQLLSKHVKLDLEGSQREIYDDYVAGVSFLTPANLEVGVNGERTLGENGSSSDSRFNLSLAYFFDDKNRYANGYNLEDASENDLASWASESVAYMDEVLAAADQLTVQVANQAPQTSNPMLQTGSNTPVITLTAGQINTIDLSDYIESANLTDAQKQATPTIAGGPSDVEFTYDNSTQSLMTKAEVPESAVEKEFPSLVLVFPADVSNENNTSLTKSSLRDALTDTLTFKVTVGGTAPQLNPAFNQNWTAVTSHTPAPWVFKYEDINNPNSPDASDNTIMFINPNGTGKYLTIPSPTDNYVVKTGDVNGCYTYAVGNGQTEQSLTITSRAASVCPDDVTYKVKVFNGVSYSQSQTINITTASADTPFVVGAPITSPTMLGGQSYAGYAFNSTGDTNVVSPGDGEAFSTTAGDNTLTVYNASTCALITDSNLSLDVTSSQITLTSTGAIPSKYVGTPLDLYLSVKNTLGYTGNNGTSCGTGTPFTATVQGAPNIPANIPLGAMTVDASYGPYDFMTDGGSTFNVTSGSTAITSTAGSVITVKDSTGTEVLSGYDLSSSLGLALSQSGDDVVLSGIVNPGYAGDTVYVTLNLANQYGSSNNSAAPAFSDAIAITSGQEPTVGSGAITGAELDQTYPGATLLGTTPGTGLSYENLNPTSDINNGTYVKVADSSGNDVTSLAHVMLSASGDVLSLQTDGTAVSSTLPNGTYNVYVHVTNGAPAFKSNCSDTDCSTLTGGSPYTMAVNSPMTLNTGVSLTGGNVDETYPDYSFVTNGVLTLGSGSLNTSESSVTFSLQGDATNTALTDTGLTATISSTDVVISGTPAAKYGNTTLNVNVSLQDSVGYPASTAVETLAIATPTDQLSVVGTGTMPAVNEEAAYTSSTLTGTTSGDGRSYVGVNTVSSTTTYVKVVDPNNNNQDVTDLMNVNLAANGEVLTLQSNGGVVSSSLHGSYNVYVHVMNDANSASSNCADTACTTFAGGTPYTVFVNTPPTIAANADMTNDATGPATVGTAYSYDFAAQGTLTLGTSTSGTTDLSSSTLTMTLADGTTPVDPSTLGLAVNSSVTDVVLAGTPLASKSGTYKVFLTVTDASGFTVNNTSAPATLVIAAASPTVIAGTMPGASLGESYSYTFANTGAGGASGPVVSAGQDEYFDEDTNTGTTFTVTGANSGVMTSQFHLEYSSNATLTGGNGVINNHNNVVSLVSNAALTSSDTLTVTFNVKNVDAKTTAGTPGTVVVGTEPAYLYCPAGSSTEVVNRQNSYSYSYDNLGMTGIPLETINFTKGSSNGSGLVQLYQASIANNRLQCVYIVNSQPSSPQYIATSTSLEGLTASGSGWSGSSCSVASNATAQVAATSCKVTYTYSG